MEEKSLKTSLSQRIIIAVIAVLLVLSTVMTYLFIVVSNNNNGSSGKSDSDSSAEEEVNKLIAEYDAKNAELVAAAKPLADKHFSTLNKYAKSQVKAYNAEAAQNGVLQTEDLVTGTGKELKEGDKDYLAYYVGWCPDGKIFDSSFDNRGKEEEQEATTLNPPLDPSAGLIAGWEQGVLGMKLGGVRQITMQGALAYGETQEICGTTNSPLKFLVLPIENTEELKKIGQELDDIYMKLYMAYYNTAGN